MRVIPPKTPIDINEVEDTELQVPALPYEDLINLYPSSPSEERRSIIGSNYDSFPSLCVTMFPNIDSSILSCKKPLQT